MRNGGRNIFVTGATGALGPAMLSEMRAMRGRLVVMVRPGTSRAFDDGITTFKGDVTDESLPRCGFDASDIDVIVHAAADTRFRAPRDEQERVNVMGTRNMLAWAKQRFPRLRRFVLVSTTCVAGIRTGSIAETISPDQPEFVNFYEATKWHAEQLVRDSGLPFSIVRLSTAIGSKRDGTIVRFGAIHYALRWMHRGLVPMLPGTEDTPIDLISTDLAASALARAAADRGNDMPQVVHVAAGSRAVPLGELLDFIVEEFRSISPAWRQRQLRRPLVVDRETFELFQDSIRRSGDVLFRTVLDATSAFLPGLLHPKIYETGRAEQLFGDAPLPLPDWRELLRTVIARTIAEWEVCHA